MQWEEGKSLVFDDSYLHEVRYVHDEEHHTANGHVPLAEQPLGGARVVLLFDVWHPGITMDERQEITHMFKEAQEEGLFNGAGDA